VRAFEPSLTTAGGGHHIMSQRNAMNVPTIGPVVIVASNEPRTSNVSTSSRMTLPETPVATSKVASADGSATGI
jgi:hypothetical protein